MSFLEISLLDDGHYLHTARMGMRANGINQAVGSISHGLTTATMTMRANKLLESEFARLRTASLGMVAASLEGVPTWQLKTARMMMRSPQLKWSADAYVGINPATMNMRPMAQDSSSYETLESSQLNMVANTTNWQAWWELKTAQMPMKPNRVIVQIGGVSLTCSPGQLIIRANTIRASDAELVRTARMNLSANDLVWQSTWVPKTATLILKARQLKVMVGDRLEELMTATLSMVAPVLYATENPVLTGVKLTIIAKQLGWQQSWSIKPAKLNMVAKTLTKIIGPRQELLRKASMTMTAASALQYYEFERLITAQLQIIANSLNSYAEISKTMSVARLNMVANRISALLEPQYRNLQSASLTMVANVLTAYSSVGLTTARLTMVANSLGAYSSVGLITARMDMVANSLGGQATEAIVVDDVYEAMLQNLDPAEANVEPEDWYYWS